MAWLAFGLCVGGTAVIFWPARLPQSHFAEEATVFAAGFMCAVGCMIVVLFATNASDAPLAVLPAGAVAALSPLWLHLARRYRAQQLFGDLERPNDS